MKPLRNSIHKFLKSAEVTFFEGLYRDYGKKELKSVRTSAYKLLF